MLHDFTNKETSDLWCTGLVGIHPQKEIIECMWRFTINPHTNIKKSRFWIRGVVRDPVAYAYHMNESKMGSSGNLHEITQTFHHKSI